MYLRMCMVVHLNKQIYVFLVAWRCQEVPRWTVTHTHTHTHAPTPTPYHNELDYMAEELSSIQECCVLNMKVILRNFMRYFCEAGYVGRPRGRG